MNDRPPTPGPGRPKVTRWPLLLAALLVLIVAIPLALSWWRARQPAPAPPPEAAGPSANALTLFGPEAAFSWARDPRASMYRIEVYDQIHHLLAAAVLRDTTIRAGVLLPDTSHGGTWRVIVVTAAGTELAASTPAAFERP